MIELLNRQYKVSHETGNQNSPHLDGADCGRRIRCPLTESLTQSNPPIPIELLFGQIDGGFFDSYRFDQDGLTLNYRDGKDVKYPHPVDVRIWEKLSEAGIPRASGSPNDSSTESLLTIWLPVLIVIVVVIFFLRKFGGGGQFGNLFELRKTKARVVQDADKARFSDIGGNQEAVELLGDLVDFLNAPDRWTAAGARIPHGILVVGPPGTGKTLLARAVAGEANSAFFYVSAAEFVELFVGIGAARVRDTFEKATAQQPAVIFIDEIDAIGRRRGSGVGTMHEEREQTLNQLLVLMDGLERRSRVVVVAATNRPDVLDPALLRSGRFDRMVRLNPPSAAERIEILKIHTRNKQLAADVSLEKLAQMTDAFTGADLEVLANEAALRAIRRVRAAANGEALNVTLNMTDFTLAHESMVKSNRQFDRLDTVLVESASQFSEPVGCAVARVTLTTGTVLEGEVQWMNATYIKLRTTDGSEVVIAKESAAQIVAIAGTEVTPAEDFQPDRWAERTPEVG